MEGGGVEGGFLLEGGKVVRRGVMRKMPEGETNIQVQESCFRYLSVGKGGEREGGGADKVVQRSGVEEVFLMLGMLIRRCL